MEHNYYNYFILFYYILDSLCDKENNEELSLFISDVNPFLFRGEGSADPAIYDDFKTICNAYKKAAANGYDITKIFVDQKCPQCVKDIFSDITEEEWDNAYHMCF